MNKFLRWEIKNKKAPYEGKNWVSTDRGWAWQDGWKSSVGFYIDYEETPRHQRMHLTKEREEQLKIKCECVTCQPGTICAFYNNKKGTCISRWFETIIEAMIYIQENYEKEYHVDFK